MKTRDLIKFLTLEVLALAVAGGAFALIESRLVAGLAAGSYFVLSSAWMLGRILGWPPRDRVRAFTTYPLLIHLFLISIPMVIARLSHANVDFAEVRVWGLPGPVFHGLSTKIFAALMVATAVDLGRSAWARRLGRG